MTKKGIERNLAVLLFVLVLITFSLAEKDSKKLERLYSTAQLLKSAKTISTAATTLQQSSQR